VGESDLESDVGEDGRWGVDGGWREAPLEGNGNEGGEVLEYAVDVSLLFPDGGDIGFQFGDEELAGNEYGLVPQWTGDGLGDVWPEVGDADFDFDLDFKSTAIGGGDAAPKAGDVDVELDIELFA
jgi:hypothetical protein